LYIFATHNRFRAVTSDVVTHFITWIIERLDLGVFGDVDQDRAGAAGTGYVEGLGQCPRDFPSIGNLVIPFGNRSGNVDHIRFLEGIGAEQVGKYLAGYADDGIAIDHGVSKASYQVCGPRPTGCEDHSYTARSARIALCCMDATLLVAHQDMLYLFIVIIKRIINRHDGAAGVTEYGIHTFCQQRFEHSL